MAEDTTRQPPPPSVEEAQDELAELLGKAFDIVRYAPIGALLDGPSLLPQLAEQGKVHVRNAEWLGRMALRRGRDSLMNRLGGVSDQAVDFLRLMGVLPPDEDTPPPRGGVPPPAGAAPPPATTVPDAPSPDELAIPDYDSLSASHVVNRLPSLSTEELEAIRAYESAHRGRKTILNKVVQLTP